jgi:hypothetical protein
MGLSPFPSIHWGWFFPFRWWFPSWNGGYFKSKDIYLCFGLFTTSFFWRPLGNVVWTFMILFCPKWIYKWFQTFSRSMWAHCLKSCSTFSITFVFYISIFSIGNVIWRHTSHHN